MAQRSSVEQAIAFYADLALSVAPRSTPRVVPGDVDDDHVIAAAVAGSADLVVSGERHRLAMGSHQDIGIVVAAEAAEAEAEAVRRLVAA